MRRALKPLEVTAGLLVFAAALVWTLYFARIFQFRRSTASIPPAHLEHSPSPPAREAAPARHPEDDATALDPSALALEEELDALIREPDRGKRKALIARLSGKSWATRTMGKLKSFLRDELRRDSAGIASLDLLKGLPDESQFTILCELTADGTGGELRSDLLRRLTAKTQFPEQVAKLSEIYAAEPSDIFRAVLVLGVEESCPVVGKSLIQRSLGDGSAEIRALAISSLNAEVESERALLLRFAGSDASEHVRADAVLLLAGRIEDPEVVAMIAGRVSTDTSAEVRLQAVRALQKSALSSTPIALNALDSATRDPSEEVRTEAKRMLEASRARKGE